MKTALVGLGRIHPTHAAALERVPGLEAVAGYDPSPEARCEIAGVARMGSLRELIGRGDIEAAIVAVPTLDHAEVSADLLDAGIHVLIEKPLAVTLAEFEELYRRSTSSGAVCFSALHDSVGDEVVHYIEKLAPELAPAFGTLVSVHATYHDPYAARGELEERRPGLVGSWLDSGSNALSVVARFADHLTPVEAGIVLDAPGGPDVEDVAARVTFSGREVGGGGAPVEAIVDTSWLEDRKSKQTRLTYEGGTVLLEHEERRITIEESSDGCRTMVEATPLDRLVSQYVRVFDEFERLTRAGTDNREFARAVHLPLLRVYGPDLSRRYLAG